MIWNNKVKYSKIYPCGDSLCTVFEGLFKINAVEIFGTMKMLVIDNIEDFCVTWLVFLHILDSDWLKPIPLSTIFFETHLSLCHHGTGVFMRPFISWHSFFENHFQGMKEYNSGEVKGLLETLSIPHNPPNRCKKLIKYN